MRWVRDVGRRESILSQIRQQKTAGAGQSWRLWDGCLSGGSATWDLSDTYRVTIPSCIAARQYLLRIQQLAIHNPYPAGIPQFYISCAQVKVTGGGGSLPSGVSIPGYVSASGKYSSPGL